MKPSLRRSIVVAGPTASGKSDLALALARSLGGEIVSCDSVQLYRGFDIGSAKPTPNERQEIVHHMVDVIDWHDAYDASRYAKDARMCLEQIRRGGKIPIIVGGTGLYLRALWRDSWDDLPSDSSLREELALLSNDQLHHQLAALNPQRAEQIHRNDRYRLQRGLEIALLAAKGVPPKSPSPQPSGEARADHFVILLMPPRELLHERIVGRTAKMLAAGLVEEVARLRAEGCPLAAKPMQSIGYRQVAQLLTGELPADELEEAIRVATRQYAKRQRTWFNKVPADLCLAESELTSDDLLALQAALGL